jgi:hypothetical protein
MHANIYTLCMLSPIYSKLLLLPDTILVFIVLHPNSNGFLPLFVDDYKLDRDFKLSYDFLKLAFHHMLCLCGSDPSVAY